MRTILGLCTAAALTLLISGGTAAAAERTWICGRIGAFARPTSATAGSVTIGTRTLPIAPGVAFYPESSLPDPQTGAVMCLIGELGAVGQFISITAVNPFVAPYAQCGPVVVFTAATSTAPGEIVLIADGTRRTLTIKTGTLLPAASSSGYRCFTQELTAQGDLLVIGTQPLPAGFVTPVPTAPGTLPSTSTALDPGPPSIGDSERFTFLSLPAATVAALSGLALVALLVPIFAIWVRRQG